MPGSHLQVTPALALPEEELAWSFTGSGGPGGQHANTANTKVTLEFSVATSASLAPHQRQRLLEVCGPVVRVVVSDERSQARNRDLARARLAARLAAALRVPRTRRASRPSAGAAAARVAEKRLRGARKRDRAASRRSDGED